MNRAVFLDRDGTVIEEVGYISDPSEVRVLPGARAALLGLREAGYRLVIATNQSGIGRGYFAEEDYEAVHRAMVEALGFGFDGAYHCPHAPEAKCSCRKPAPGMLLRAAEELGLALSRSWMIGDRDRDALAGLAAGCRALRLGDRAGPEGEGAPKGVRTVPDLAAAAEAILADEGEDRA